MNKGSERNQVYRYERIWFGDQYPEKAQASQKILDDLSKSLEDRRESALEYYKSIGVSIQESG